MLFFFGIDQYSYLSEARPEPRLGPLVVDSSMTNFQMRLGTIVFQKLGDSGTWYVRSQGLQGERLLFDSAEQVSHICLAVNTIVGFSVALNQLQKVDFVLEFATCEISFTKMTVEMADSSILLKQIFTNDSIVFALDNSNKVYEVGRQLTLKWRIDAKRDIVKVACGFNHFMALSDTGALYSWGGGGRGELGHFENSNVMQDSNEPRRIEFFDDLPCVVKDVACGGWHTVVLTSDGDIYSFGWNESGQLGHPKENKTSISGVPYPCDLGDAIDPVMHIACGGRHSVAVLKSGKMYAWGFNKFGQLGLGDLENRQEPSEIKGLPCSSKIFQIDCGRWHTFVRTQ